MNKILLGVVALLLIAVAVLAVGLSRTASRVDALERQLEQEIDRISDDFLQEDDFYPILEGVYEQIESIREEGK
jgi:hypothetical protein